MMQPAERGLSFPGLLNVRDLGGYPTTDGDVTRARSLLRSDDPAQLTAHGLQCLSDYGVETVIDLRWASEAAESPSPIERGLRHIRYQRISLLAEDPAEWMARLGRRSKEEWKCAVLEHVRAELRTVLKTIAAASPGPLLFHCLAGKDRTGVIAALLLALADATPAAIAADYARSAGNLRAAYLKRYASAEPAAILEHVRCPEEAVHRMLAYLEQAGGIRAYLEAIGLSVEEVERLRARLRS